MSVFDPRSGWRLVVTSVVGGLKEGGGLKTSDASSEGCAFVLIYKYIHCLSYYTSHYH